LKELLPGYMRHVYWMKEWTFWLLHITLSLSVYLTTRKQKDRDVDAQMISFLPQVTSALSAIQYFAGGSHYAIQLTHRVSHTNIFRSVWIVVDTMNRCKKLEIKFPEDHAQQRHIAQVFKACSPQAKVCACVGAIDGIVTWIEKPWHSNCNLTSHMWSQKIILQLKDNFWAQHASCLQCARPLFGNVVPQHHQCQL
jgi:hypothetical protein